jgi:hypothetical protein
MGFKHSSSIPPVITEVFSDIIWEHGPISYVIDLVVTDPSGKTINSLISSGANPRAYNTINVAALYEEKEKRLKYHQVIDPNRVVPFAIEATGCLGPSAHAFLHRVCGPNTYYRSHFLNFVSNISACFSAKCLSASREQFHAPPQIVAFSRSRFYF